jgi:tRNA(fMet)-specific endonuclease VapC
MARYLLDTNVLSDLMKNPEGRVAQRIQSLSSDDRVCTSVIVAAELHFGAIKKNVPSLTQQVDELLAVLEVLPLQPDADRHYGKIRAYLEQHGKVIGGNDMLVAAQALAEGCTLVTGNRREFHRVPGLKIENWLIE